MAQNKIVPCLWFNQQAEEAVKFYTSTFKDAKIGRTAHYGEEAATGSGQKQGSVLTIEFSISGQEFLALNGGPAFQFSQAISFFVWCETEEEIHSLWSALSSGGKTMLKLDRYPFAERYGWCVDRFGVSWQLILGRERQKVSPALLFVKDQAGRAEEAMKLYTSLFPNSKIETVARDEKTNVILHARFLLDGQLFVAMESPIQHDFQFTPAVSLIVKCDDQKEIDHYWNGLSFHKQAEQCGWLSDKFGISWQIVPRELADWTADPNPVKSNQVMKALLKMKKLQIEPLRQAYHSA